MRVPYWLRRLSRRVWPWISKLEHDRAQWAIVHAEAERRRLTEKAAALAVEEANERADRAIAEARREFQEQLDQISQHVAKFGFDRSECCRYRVWMDVDPDAFCRSRDMLDDQARRELAYSVARRMIQPLADGSFILLAREEERRRMRSVVIHDLLQQEAPSTP